MHVRALCMRTSVHAHICACAHLRDILSSLEIMECARELHSCRERLRKHVKRVNDLENEALIWKQTAEANKILAARMQERAEACERHSKEQKSPFEPFEPCWPFEFY